MNQTDLIILVVYLICVFYVLFQAWNSLEDRTKIELDQAAYVAQLGTPQGAIIPKDYVDVEFDIRPSQRFDFSNQPKKLTTTIRNKSRTTTLLVDWDRSILTNYENSARRVIRFASNLEKIPDTQPPSTIRPGQNIKEDLVADKMLKDDQQGNVELSKPIVDLVEIEQEAEKEGPFPSEGQAKRVERLRKMYDDFFYRVAPIKFSLNLYFEIEEVREGERKRSYFYLLFTFNISRGFFREYIPWNPRPFRTEYYPSQDRRRNRYR